MQLARYVVDAVVLEGRSVREVARAHGVSKSWVAELVRRYREGGDEALEPRSKRPHSSPRRTPDVVEDEIVRLRKRLSEGGFDAGPETIAWQLELIGLRAPSYSTIWRILVRRGFVTPEPKKRLVRSYITFTAALPNECWQSDITHWALADGTEVEIVNFRRRPLAAVPRFQGLCHHQGPRRADRLRGCRHHLGLPGLGAHGQWCRLQRRDEEGQDRL